MKEKILSQKQIRIRTFSAFAIFIIAMTSSVFIWKWIRHQPQDQQIPTTLRKGLMTNEKIFGSLFNEEKLVETYPVSEAVKKVRVNGNLGLKDKNVDTANWRLQ